MALYDLSSGEVSWDPLSLGHYEGTHHHNHCYGMKYLLKPNSNLDLTAERFPKDDPPPPLGVENVKIRENSEKIRGPPGVP